MCRSTVAIVRSVAGDVAVVELDTGERRRACTLAVPDVTAGEAVLIGLGTILGRVGPTDLAALRAIEAASPGGGPPPAPIPGEAQGAVS